MGVARDAILDGTLCFALVQRVAGDAILDGVSGVSLMHSIIDTGCINNKRHTPNGVCLLC